MSNPRDFGRTPDILHRVDGDFHHLAPIPLVYEVLDMPDLESFHQDLIDVAKEAMPQVQIDVPDVRHREDMGRSFKFEATTWSEEQVPAIGVWHGVPTNNFLDLPAEPVQRLRKIVVDRYQSIIDRTLERRPSEPWISESWIQFYRDGDYKVLHNHERYAPPIPQVRWSGGYYISDGTPDPAMPYSGMFSFRVRQANYYIRPRAGLLLMWPSDILHEVAPFYGEDERIIVNFNINEQKV